MHIKEFIFLPLLFVCCHFNDLLLLLISMIICRVEGNLCSLLYTCPNPLDEGRTPKENPDIKFGLWVTRIGLCRLTDHVKWICQGESVDWQGRGAKHVDRSFMGDICTFLPHLLLRKLIVLLLSCFVMGLT